VKPSSSAVCASRTLSWSAWAGVVAIIAVSSTESLTPEPECSAGAAAGGNEVMYKLFLVAGVQWTSSVITRHSSISAAAIAPPRTISEQSPAAHQVTTACLFAGLSSG